MAPQNVVHNNQMAVEPPPSVVQEENGGGDSPRRPPSPRTAAAAGLRVTKEAGGDRVCRRISDGARHAVGGLPAVVRANGDLEWYCDDQLHRDEDDKPAVRRTSGVSEWRRRGRLHRDGGRPAVVCYDMRPGVSTDRRPHREWWVDGRRHRPGGLPAIEHANGSVEYWENGVRHRCGGLPAVVLLCGHEEWWECGMRHRDGDLPAVVCSDGTSEWYCRGLPHREGDKPAYVRRTRDWAVKKRTCYVITFEPTADGDCGFRERRRHGAVVEERWYWHGALHRGMRADGSPATADYVHVEVRHAPAVVRYDPATGKCTSREWYSMDRRHRHDLDAPAVQLADGREEWWWFGDRHRRHGDGKMTTMRPAVVCADGSLEFYRHGRRLYLPHLVRPAVGAYRAVRATLGRLCRRMRRAPAAHAVQDDADARLDAAERGRLLGGGKED